MSFSIRPARAGDKAAIASFTQNTFEWGDYVTDRFDEWLDDPKGVSIVGVDHDDTDSAIRIARGHPRNRSVAETLCGALGHRSTGMPSRGRRVPTAPLVLRHT